MARADVRLPEKGQAADNGVRAVEKGLEGGEGLIESGREKGCRKSMPSGVDRRASKRTADKIRGCRRIGWQRIVGVRELSGRGRTVGCVQVDIGEEMKCEGEKHEKHTPPKNNMTKIAREKWQALSLKPQSPNPEQARSRDSKGAVEGKRVRWTARPAQDSGQVPHRHVQWPTLDASKKNRFTCAYVIATNATATGLSLVVARCWRLAGGLATTACRG